MVSQYVTLKEIASFNPGTKIPKPTSGKKISFVRISDMQNGIIKSTVDKKIPLSTDSISKLPKKTKIKKDDVLLSTQATLGKVAIASSKNAGNYVTPQINLIRCKDHKYLPDYLASVLSSKQVRDFLKLLATGTVIQRVRNDLIGEIKIPKVSIVVKTIKKLLDSQIKRRDGSKKPVRIQGL